MSNKELQSENTQAHQQVILGPNEALQYIRSQHSSEQALSMLAQFWGMVPQGSSLELSIFELYREISRRDGLDHSSTNERVLGQLSIRIASLAISLMSQFQISGNSSDLDFCILCFREATPLLDDGNKNKPIILSNFGNALLLRFERGGSKLDLEESITYQNDALSLTMPSDPSLPMRLRSLGIVLRHRFEQTGSLEDLEKAISSIREALMLLPDNHPHLSMIQNDLGQALRERFDHSGRSEDIEDAIAAHHKSLSNTPDTDPQMAERLNGLAMSLVTRYNYSSSVSDINEAQSCYEKALKSTADGHPDKPVRLYNLANLLHIRYKRFGKLSDLSHALSLHQSAVQIVPDKGKLKPTMLNGLAGSLHLRFEYFGNIEDIEAALAHRRDALILLSAMNHAVAPTLNELGASLVLKFQNKGDLSDLDEAISLQTRATLLTSEGDSQRPFYLSNLSSSMLDRYRRLRIREDVDKAINHADQAVKLTPTSHTHRAGRLVALATALGQRFDHFGLSEDIERAISCCTEALSLTPDGHIDKSRWLNTLGSLYTIWFEHTGNLAHIDEAILFLDQAVLIAADTYHQKPIWLTNLGKSLLARFEQLLDRADIDRSIEIYRLAINLTPTDYSGMAQILSGLGNALRVRFENFRVQADLEDAIDAHSRARDLTTKDHTSRTARPVNLANSLVDRNVFLKDVSSLDEALVLYREALKLTNEDDPQRPIWLNNMGVSLIHRYELFNETSDLEEGMGYLKTATSLAPDTLPEKARWLRNLAYAIQFRVAQDPSNQSNKTDLIETLFQANRTASALPSIRLEAARYLSNYSTQLNLGNPLVAYSLAMETLPANIWLGTTIRHRLQNVARLNHNLVSEAAAEAIKFGQFHVALGWLEEGRSIIWNQILNLRIPVDKLRKADEALAERLQEVSILLDQRQTEGRSEARTERTELATRNQHRLATEWEGLVQRARNIPGFEDFLKPLKSSALVKASHSSTVVLINVHPSRCDALAIPYNSQTILHVPLPKITHQRIVGLSRRWANSFRSNEVRQRGFKTYAPTSNASQGLLHILAILWVDIVQPILERLGYGVVSDQNKERPRVTWCATGPLSFLPLHAAGIYQPGSKQKTFECVVSSYTPTISALLVNPPSPDDFAGIITVGQATTQGMSALPGTTEELDKIQSLAEGVRITRLEGSKAAHESVIQGMHEHSWVHLACHASQDLDDPTSSAFYLHDKPLDMATISQNPFKNAGLAFLSACQTATGVEELSEEAVHLAAGMLMSGYPSVIATMWSVRDQDAPIIAEKVYARLFDGGSPSTQHTARALHDAVAFLREMVGEEYVEAWAPYIHIGL
ncbi:CHAT domain protein [Ceratobasidium sp. AG-Ba]|nr:CHAT domain protein [Ceratobasidium sp. AG-Ba]